MTARYLQGDPRMGLGYPVATAQAVERFDMVALVAGTVVRAADTAWASAVAAPSAPTVADTADDINSGLTNAATSVKISYNFPWGEGALSAAGTATPTAQAGLLVTGLTPASPALSTNVYVEDAAGSGVYKLWGVVQGGSAIVDAYGTGRVPPTAVTSGALQVTQYNFAQAFLGVSNQRKVANVARIFGNSRDNEIMVIRGPGAIVEFDCASASFAVGDYVGAAKDSGNALLNQTVVAVANEGLAIGRVAHKETTVTKIAVELLSRYTADLKA